MKRSVRRRSPFLWTAICIWIAILTVLPGCAPVLYDWTEPDAGVRAGKARPAASQLGASSRRMPPYPVRGIYVSSNTALGSRMDKLIELVRTTELNAMVIDVNSGVSLVNMPPGKMTGSRSASAAEMRKLVKRLKRHRIYLIARIVTFKNPQLARAMPAWAMKKEDGKIWTDKKGSAWIDPYRQEAWQYPIALAKEAARIGFDEVQFDYVRFPENPETVEREVKFHNPNRWRREEAIRRFLHEAVRKVHAEGAIVSADVFGLVGSARDDMGIGQSWPAIASEVDVISPMVYPSHYSSGIWGIRQPDLKPGAVVTHALRDALDRNRSLRKAGRPPAQVRPWLQSFTATWVHPHQRYGPEQIREQVRAASRLGVTSYLLWNSSNKYPAG